MPIKLKLYMGATVFKVGREVIVEIIRVMSRTEIHLFQPAPLAPKHIIQLLYVTAPINAHLAVS